MFYHISNSSQYQREEPSAIGQAVDTDITNNLDDRDRNPAFIDFDAENTAEISHMLLCETNNNGVKRDETSRVRNGTASETPSGSGMSGGPRGLIPVSAVDQYGLGSCADAGPVASDAVLSDGPGSAPGDGAIPTLTDLLRRATDDYGALINMAWTKPHLSDAAALHIAASALDCAIEDWCFDNHTDATAILPALRDGALASLINLGWQAREDLQQENMFAEQEIFAGAARYEALR